MLTKTPSKEYYEMMPGKEVRQAVQGCLSGYYQLMQVEEEPKKQIGFKTDEDNK